MENDPHLPTLFAKKDVVLELRAYPMPMGMPIQCLCREHEASKQPDALSPPCGTQPVKPWQGQNDQNLAALWDFSVPVFLKSAN